MQYYTHIDYSAVEYICPKVHKDDTCTYTQVLHSSSIKECCCAFSTAGLVSWLPGVPGLRIFSCVSLGAE